MDKTGSVVADALVYGSQQSNSSANGTIPSPELATLEGVQSQGGRVVVVPSLGRRGIPSMETTPDRTNKSVGRYPDGADSDDNLTDFLWQTSKVSSEPLNESSIPTPGKPNQY